ncbi:MAG: DUF2339 domain-containing protein [Sedimentisphaeraceae bacterium JB056]
MEMLIIPFLVLLGISIIIISPTALIISIIAIRRINRLTENKNRSNIHRPVPQHIPQPPQKPAPPAPLKPETPVKANVREKYSKPTSSKDSVEQLIGTRWVLFAGIITVIIGVGLFMKYAYDNALIGPLGRVIIAAISGIAALAIGEITRRKAYGVVAKSVTALGFAILYASVFAAYQFYGLIDMFPAFILTILITLASMLYAVSLNENIIAVLSLLGGFSAPLLITIERNMPFQVFTYILILGCGAMLCSYYRRWRLVNLLAFILTVVNYFLWLDKFILPVNPNTDGIPKQLPTAIIWAVIFFAVYLVLPLLNGFIRRIKAEKADVLLVIANSAATFLLLSLMLYAKYRTALAFSAIALCVSHLVIMKTSIAKCRQDMNLRLSLLTIGLLFLTIAIPLYFQFYVLSIAWAVEAVVLILVGLKYRSIWTQAGGIIILILSVFQLFLQIPLHRAVFTLVFNPSFGSWIFVTSAVMTCHVLYRKSKLATDRIRKPVSEPLYCGAISLLILTCAMEWFYYCKYNMISMNMPLYLKGMIVIISASLLTLSIRPICPSGNQCRAFSAFIAIAGSIFTLIAFTEIHKDSFTIFINPDFPTALILLASMAASSLSIRKRLADRSCNIIFSNIIAITAIIFLWMLLNEEIYLYWYCKNRFSGPAENWRFLANMYISVMWAIYGGILMIGGFYFKKAAIRYIALGLFAILLFKVFIFDMSTVKSVYRIAAFLATGIILVGVSYLYQHLKNKGFFEKMGIDKQITHEENK